MPRSRCRRRTALELPGLRRMPVDRAVAQRLFEQAERLEVLGGAPGDEAGASAAPAEGERQRPEPRRGQPVEVVERQPGEPGPGRHREQAGGAGPEHGRGAPAGVAEQPLQQAVEGGRVEVDPRPGGEIAGCGSALQQRMALEGGPAGRPDPGAGARSAGAAGTMRRGSGMRDGARVRVRRSVRAGSREDLFRGRDPFRRHSIERARDHGLGYRKGRSWPASRPGSGLKTQRFR